MTTRTRRRPVPHFLTIQPSDPTAAPIRLDDRAAIVPGSSLDILITTLEELAYRGYEGGTPAALTVTLEDQRSFTLTPGPAFLSTLAAPPAPSTARNVRIPVYIVHAHPTL